MSLAYDLPAAAHLSRAELIAKYEGRAPRYTSYPTALQFSPAVDEAVYRAWLRQLPAADPVSLYLHIPFCSRLCWYCGCNTRATTRHEPVSEYVALLLRELDMLRDALPGRLEASAIHLGGGTPNLLSVGELNAIFPALKRAFAITPDHEVAAELDPASLTEAWVHAAAFHGLTRASLGVQNLDPQVQAAVNRLETFEQIAACVGWLRDVSVRSINLDLMYGLPHQTTENTLATVDAIVDLQPERIALFGYAHVPWMKAHQKLIDESALPGPEARLEQSEAAADRLIAAGYVRIGIDHFALPHDSLATASADRTLRRNFQGYTTDEAPTLLGLGASAIGRLPQGFVQNASQEAAWREAVKAGRLSACRGAAMTRDDLFRGEIIERLMCDFEVDLGAVWARHGRPNSDLAAGLARLQPFLEDGLVTVERGHVAIPERGRFLVRSICTAFDSYFAANAAKHSATV